jgi:hypothetical protein
MTTTVAENGRPLRPSDAPRAPDPRPVELVERLERYAERHRAMENYIFAWWLMFRFFAWLGLSPTSPRGRLASIVWVMAVITLVPTGVALVAGEGADAPISTFAGLGVVFGVLGMLIYTPFRTAIDTFLSLQRAMVDPVGVDRLVSFDGRYFRIGAAMPFGVVFASSLLALFWVVGSLQASSLSMGTLALAGMLLYQVGEITYTVLMLGFESTILGEYDYALHRLSPIDSLPVRRAMRGSTQVGVLVSFVATAFIGGFGLLLHDTGRLAGHITFSLLVVAYAATALGVLLPRLAILRVVRAEKEREMAPLQKRLDALAVHASTLDPLEHQELWRLKQLHDAIRDSSEAVLPVGSLGQIGSALFLPTITYVVSQASEGLVGKVLATVGIVP